MVPRPQTPAAVCPAAFLSTDRVQPSAAPQTASALRVGSTGSHSGGPHTQTAAWCRRAACCGYRPGVLSAAAPLPCRLRRLRPPRSAAGEHARSASGGGQHRLSAAGVHRQGLQEAGIAAGARSLGGGLDWPRVVAGSTHAHHGCPPPPPSLPPLLPCGPSFNALLLWTLVACIFGPSLAPNTRLSPSLPVPRTISPSLPPQHTPSPPYHVQIAKFAQDLQLPQIEVQTCGCLSECG